MAPPASDSDRKLLKEKLQAATAKSGAHKAKKDPKSKAQEKADAEAKAKEAKAAKAKAAAVKTPAPAAAPAAAPAPSPFALPGDPDSEIGLHLGVSCDGCGLAPPIVGRAFKCRTCPDFDLCEDCFPQRRDMQREKVAAAAGMPGTGKHPAAHEFGARKAGSVMTRAAANAEKAAAKVASAEAAEKEKLLEAHAQARREQEVSGTAKQAPVVSMAGAAPEESTARVDTWKPCAFWAEELVMPKSAPRVFGGYAVA